jgi:cytochrome P450
MLLFILAIAASPVVIVGLYFTVIFLRACYVLRKFRGPFALPLIGNCYTSEALSIFKYLASLKKRYGKIFTFFTFSKPRLVVLDPIIARRILSDSKAFPKGDDYTHAFSYVFGGGLVTSNGEKHKRGRAIFGRFFVRANIVQWQDPFNKIADEAIDDLMKVAVSSDGKARPLNIEKFFAVCALRLFMKFCTGADYKDTPDKEMTICKIVSEASNATGTVVIFGLPLFSFMPQVKIMDKMRVVIRKEFDEAREKRLAEHARGENLDRDDCLNAMIIEKMEDRDMFDHFTTLICAGHDTSAYFSSYLVFLLAKHQDVQDKLRAEITAHFKGRMHVTADDIMELKYLAQVMQETLRFYAIIPGVSRKSAEEVHIKEASVTIPEGVELFIPMSIINR